MTPRNPVANVDLSLLGCLILQIDLFKKAGWTIVTPPSPVIPDGMSTLTSFVTKCLPLQRKPSFVTLEMAFPQWAVKCRLVLE